MVLTESCSGAAALRSVAVARRNMATTECGVNNGGDVRLFCIGGGIDGIHSSQPSGVHNNPPRLVVLLSSKKKFSNLNS